MIPPGTEEIPFGAVLSIVSRERSIFLNEQLGPLGLSSGQFPVLMLLAKEQNITQETLVRHYHLDKGTIARSVKKLETAGYIRRIVDPDNRRAVRLFLTEKGERVIPILKEIDTAWDERVFAPLSHKEKDSINILMRRIAQNCLKTGRNCGGFHHADE
jgi:MarR family transcriptional regulator, temperature-dependent positive regulator of motility